MLQHIDKDEDMPDPDHHYFAALRIVLLIEPTAAFCRAIMTRVNTFREHENGTV